ncbi:MAG: type IV pilin accessory protein [Acinetobacter sp.]|nr:type IV pilin accessory protein [Acinetobacter sp.]
MSKRLKFFLGHLLVSLLIAIAVIALVFFVWYPSPLATAVGVTHIFLILLVVDVILGPLLGLLVYKEGKKTLKMDLSIVVFIQVIALSYGIYSIYQARPAWIAFNYDHFELVRNNNIKTDHIDKAEDQYQQPTWLTPRYVAVKQATDPTEQQIIQMGAMLNGISLAQYPEYYISLNQVKEQMKVKAHALSELSQWNTDIVVQQTLKVYPNATAWLPLETYGIPMVILINKENAKVVKIVDLRPWK